MSDARGSRRFLLLLLTVLAGCGLVSEQAAPQAAQMDALPDGPGHAGSSLGQAAVSHSHRPHAHAADAGRRPTKGAAAGGPATLAAEPGVSSSVRLDGVLRWSAVSTAVAPEVPEPAAPPVPQPPRPAPPPTGSVPGDGLATALPGQAEPGRVSPNGPFPPVLPVSPPPAGQHPLQPPQSDRPPGSAPVEGDTLPLALAPAPRPVQPVQVGQPALAIESIKCRPPHEAFVMVLQGIASITAEGKVELQLAHRFSVAFDRRYTDTDPKERWCIPRKRVCWEPAEFEDWGGTDRPGATRSFRREATALDSADAMPALVEAAVATQCPAGK